MLLANTIKSIGRCAAQPFLRQQFNQLNRLTPILSSYHNFHRKEDELHQNRTGFFNDRINLHKTIHSNSALFLKYSKFWKQKAEKNETTIEPDKADGAKPLDPDTVKSELEEGKKLGLFARFKKMGKDYWYVLIPVHVATSAVWLGAFYYTSKSGVDIVGILEYYEFSETIVKQLRDSRLGHIAVAYFLYKVATPARYTVTLGGTTFAINFLSKRGIIRPMLSKDKLVQIYKDRREDLHQKVADKKQELHDKKQEFKDKYMKKD